MMGTPLGHLFVRIQKLLQMWVVIIMYSVHVVMNHNLQEEMIATNFTGLTSHLAFFYDPPIGPFSKFVYVN